MDNGYGGSCRGYFLLRFLGHKNVSILHGGFQAWLQAKLTVTARVPVVEKKIFRVNTDNSMLMETV